MPTIKTTSRRRKGRVSVEPCNGSLRLRFTACGKRQCLSLSLSDTPANRKVADAKASLIESDLAWDRFDPTLEKYKPQRAKPSQTPLVNSSEIAIDELWKQYAEFKANLIEETTLRVKYDWVAKHVTRFPTQLLSDAVAIRNHLVFNCTPCTAKQILIQLSSCCKWAIGSGLITSNPFEGMASDIRVRGGSYENIQPFTEVEREAIIDAFSCHKEFAYYTPMVKFFFWTGCRTGEAVALQWKHVSDDCNLITFSESVSTGLRIRKCTKTGKARTFPSSPYLRLLLLSIKPISVDPEALVLTSKRGKEVNASSFLRRAWKSVLKELQIPYRSQYNTRHTFISECLQRGIDAATVAKWVGNSPEIIWKHYAGTNDKVLPPDFKS